jgi:nucleoside-diphosphate-sugar epimerase
MKVVITGGGGMLGRKLARKLLAGTTLVGPDGADAIVDELLLFDAAHPDDGIAADDRVTVATGDITDRATVDRLIDRRTSSIFHFAAVVSGGAEADFDLGYRVNLDGSRNVLEAARATGNRPRVLFTSSLAAYGGERSVDDRTPLTPRTSYGVQKATGELLINDFTRRGFVDGRTLRLPTIVIRPGKPNRAASGFASSILREPLQGQRAICPVSSDTCMLILSPRRTVEAFVHMHNLPGDALGPVRSVLLNGISPSMAECVEAMRAMAGEATAALVDWRPDPAIQLIVDEWPWIADGARARDLGFRTDADVAEIIRYFVDEELGGRLAAS